MSFSHCKVSCEPKYDNYRSGVSRSQTNSAGVNASLSEGRSLTQQSQATRQQATSLQQAASNTAQTGTNATIEFYKAPQNAKYLKQALTEASSAMAKGDYAGAIEAIQGRADFYSRASQIQPKAESVTAPTQVGGGAAAPTAASMDKDYDAGKQKAESTGNAKQYFNANKGRAQGSGGTAPVAKPNEIQSAQDKVPAAVEAIKGAGAEVKEAKQELGAKVNTAMPIVGETADGTLYTGEKMGDKVFKAAATDAAISAVQAGAAFEKPANAVGKIIGKPGLGTKAVDGVLNAAGVDPAVVRAADKPKGSPAMANSKEPPVKP
jgi:hypothetical protein